MSQTRKTARAVGLTITTDMMMGVAGCGLALASTSFGIFMTMRGPSADFGKGHDFTVFAQLAPRAVEPDARALRSERPQAAPEPRIASTATEDLDLTSTASIPVARPGGADAAANDMIASATVEVATDKAATISIDGHVRTVRVGDTLGLAGDVLAINPGTRPSVRTTRGMIFSSR